MMNIQHLMAHSADSASGSPARSPILRFGAAVLLSVAVCVNAMAQSEAEFTGIEEIIVTATKRVQSLQDIAMSVSAISSEELQAMGATEFFDYATKVPNLGYGYESDGRFDARKIGIRGIFSGGENQDATGFYIDETPVPQSMNPRVIDVERIEVLRGPQGTLYGARSMGGTVRVITKQPVFNEHEGGVHAKMSTVKEGKLNWAIDGSVNIPLVEDRAAIRVLAYFTDNSGIYDRVNVPTTSGPAFENNNVDSEQYYGLQVAGLFQLNDAISFSPKVLYQKIEADGLPFADLDPDNFTMARNFDVEEPGSDEWWLVSAPFDWDLEFGMINSTTSYFERKIDEEEDETEVLPFFIPFVPPAPAPLTEIVEFDAIVHETRFTSAFDGPLQFTVGIFYQDTNHLRLYPPAIYPGLAAALGAPPTFDLVFQTDTTFDTKEYAVFGEVSYDVTEWLTATVGGRYSKTEIDFFRIAGGLVTDYVPDGAFFGPDGGIDFDALMAAFPPDEIPTLDIGKQSENRFIPKFVLEARVNEDLKVYASAAEGFRVGGVNATVPEVFCAEDLETLNLSNLDDIFLFDSDSVWSYELGLKSALADNRVTVNGAVFWIDWNSLQIQNRLACGFQFIANGGKARSKGFEVEIQVAPVDNLFLTLAVGYTDAKIESTPSLVTGVAPGDPIQHVPDWTVSASGEYIFPISAGWDGFFRADFSHYGRSFSANNEPTNPRLRPSWERLNLRLGVMRNVYEVTLFVDNVTNTRANLADNRSIAAEVGGRPRIVSNRPRTIGLEARMRF